MTFERTHVPDTGEAGFSLMEAVVAMTVLLVGVLGLAQVFVLGLQHAATSTPNLIAREKSREAIESIHGGRDSRTLAFSNIANSTASDGCPEGMTPTTGGIFLSDWQPLHRLGNDGLVGTADDANAPYEMGPGPDKRFGTSDDVRLMDFERQVIICDVAPRLRAIIVGVRFRMNNRVQTYSLTSYISSFS